MADERERGGDGVGGAGGLRLGPRVEDVDDVVGGEAEGGARREDDGGADADAVAGAGGGAG